MKRNLTRYLESLTPKELDMLKTVVEISLFTRTHSGDLETLQACARILQPAMEARARDGWGADWKATIYYN